MVAEKGNGLKSRVAYLAAGVVTLAVVILLGWFDLAIPLNIRQPVASPDGDYFAYFDRAEGRAGAEKASDLIISTPAGQIVARYPMAAGSISWSNAGHLMVERDKENQATLIPKAAGSFVVLTTLAISHGTHPLWAQSGTKFAFIENGSSGLVLAVYDLLQTQSAPVPLPATLQLNDPILLFWSPGGQELFFTTTEEDQSVLYRANVISGEATPIAQLPVSWDAKATPRLSMSPDGARIYLPKPQQSVLDVESGATVWTFPADAKALWSPWSSDGAEIFYSRSSKPGKIYAHNLSRDTDREVLAGVTADGFFPDGERSYFFRTHTISNPATYRQRLWEWLHDNYGWNLAEPGIQGTHALGRVELWPRTVTRGGFVAAVRDDLFRVRYGLFNPKALNFEAFRIPTDGETLQSQIKARTVLFLALALYALMGSFVFLARPSSPPARALYVLSLISMLLFISLNLARSLHAAYSVQSPMALDREFAALGWVPLLARAHWMEDQYPLFFLFLSAVPLALLRFALSFPERSKFLAGRNVIHALLYVLALLPLATSVASIVAGPSLDLARPLLAALGISIGALVVATAFLALLYNHRRPPDRRAREQVRWVLIALSVPVAGTVFFLAGQYVGMLASGARTGGLLGGGDQFIYGGMSTTWLGPLWFFSPLAIGYALLAHKLFDIQLLFQRTLRYSLLTGVVAVIYVLLAGGMSWAIYGSLGKPSTIVLVVATIFTAMILAPARTRLERMIDRSFLRAHFDFKETMEGFAQGLPSIADRRTLATVTSRVVRAAMKTQTFRLFTLDRKTGKLRYEMTEQESAARRSKDSGSHSGVEFDPGEPLCRYLVERNRPFEVEISPYDSRLIPIFQGAAERLSRLRAAIVFGLIRNRELVGLMTLGDKITDEFYNAEDIRLLQNVARQAAVVIEKTEVFEAVALVEDLLEDQPPEGSLSSPFTPAAPPAALGCDLAGQTVSAQPPGGDYYDFVEIPGQKVGLAIGIVSGRADSAELKSSLQTELRTSAGKEKDLSFIVRRINRQLFASFRGAKHCSFFFGVYEPGEHRLEFVNAGLNPPLVLGPKGVRSLLSTGVPLGLFAETTLHARFESLEPGSLLILYSDGVTSARDAKGELFGLDRLMSSITRTRGLAAGEMAEKILGEVREFTDRLPLEEDRTIVILKTAEAPAVSPEKA